MTMHRAVRLFNALNEDEEPQLTAEKPAPARRDYALLLLAGMSVLLTTLLSLSDNEDSIA